MSDSEQPPRKRIRLMPSNLPDNLNFDRLCEEVVNDVAKSSLGWKNGQPHDEVAFLNRLTERLNRKRRNCDVGLHSRMTATSSLYFLHRKGASQKDEFGADLAVTVRVGEEWTKTALFQFKKTNDLKLRLDEDDLKGAKEDPRIAERSFVLAIDEERLAIRIEKTSLLAKKLDESGNQSIGCGTEDWRSLVEWLWYWMNCAIGPMTDPGDPAPVEGLLEAFRMSEPDEDFEFEEDPEAEALRHIPARAWLRTMIKPVDEKSF